MDLGDIYPDQFAAQAAWNARGGKNSGLKLEKLPNGTWTHIPNPNFQPGPGPVAPAPQGYGGVAAGMGPPSIEPVPATGYMDRRGGLGRDPLGPRVPTGLVDPEGRPLYQGATIAGVRTPGGPDVPLSIHEEIDLNNRLTGGDMSFPMGMPVTTAAGTAQNADIFQVTRLSAAAPYGAFSLQRFRLQHFRVKREASAFRLG